MNQFINRKEELAFLTSEYNREGSSLVVLYGRRRIGKTTLLAEFSKAKPALYFLATEENEMQNRKVFQSLVAEYCDSELLRNARIESWDPLFRSWVEKARNAKPVLIIDEFQYLGKTNPAFPSVFQRIWDTLLKDQNVMVILCGSLVSMMESQTLRYSSPLYGRRTGQIKLKQIPFREYHHFMPEKSRDELIQYYAVTGGVPKYIELFQGSEDIERGIEKHVLSRQSYLYDEPNFLLQREVAEVGSYFSVIKAIAAGNHKLSKIAGSLELKQTGLSKYLKTLMDLDILEREVPITEENPEKSKKGLYRIKDHFLLFWFKFVYPNLGALESGHGEHVMQRIRQNFIDQHVSYVYESICLEELWKRNANHEWEFTFDKAGRWWDANQEIDLVAYDSQGTDIIFGECKYWEGKVGCNVLEQLEEKAMTVSWKRESRHNHFVLFSRNGFTEELQEMENTRKDLKLIEETH